MPHGSGFERSVRPTLTGVRWASLPSYLFAEWVNHPPRPVPSGAFPKTSLSRGVELPYMGMRTIRDGSIDPDRRHPGRQPAGELSGETSVSCDRR